MRMQYEPHCGTYDTGIKVIQVSYKQPLKGLALDCVSECVQAVSLMSLVMRAFHCVERFHMTSWRPVILVFRNNRNDAHVVVQNKPRKGFFLLQSICIDMLVT